MGTRAAIEVRLEDGRQFKLGPSDWIGEGGEGAVYKKQNLAIKIIEDKAALAKKEPKLNVFKKIRHEALASPLSLAYDQGGALVGYAMDVVEGVPLARLMSPAWRAQNGYNDGKIQTVCKNMALALLALHARGAWGGDINEFNWCVQGERVVLIDCDSWGCQGYGVSAMMPSIADPKAKGHYGQESDWYALAVLFFALYAGVHPFRGSLDGFGPKDMGLRMEQGASLMRNGARWPASVPGPGAVPKGLRDWMLSTLEGARREQPPEGDWSGAKKQRKPVNSLGALEMPSAFERWASQGLGLLADGSCFDFRSRKALKAPYLGALRWFDAKTGQAWWVWQDGDALSGAPMDQGPGLGLKLAAGAKVIFWGQEIFAVKKGSWSSYGLRKIGSHGMQAIALAQGLLGDALEVFDGCLICASLGAHAMMRPMGQERGAMMFELKSPAQGARLVQATAQGPFECVEWRLSSGASEALLTLKGKPLGSIEGSLDWACALGDSDLLVQVSAEAWIVNKSGKQTQLKGWEASMSPSQCDQGLLWRVESGSARAKAYPVAKIIAG